MGGQPRPQEGSPGKGKASWWGRTEENSPALWFPAWSWCLSRRVGEELGRAVSLLLDDRAITKIAGTGEEKGKEKQAPGQDRAG